MVIMLEDLLSTLKKVFMTCDLIANTSLLEIHHLRENLILLEISVEPVQPQVFRCWPAKSPVIKGQHIFAKFQIFLSTWCSAELKIKIHSVLLPLHSDHCFQERWVLISEKSFFHFTCRYVLCNLAHFCITVVKIGEFANPSRIVNPGIGTLVRQCDTQTASGASGWAVFGRNI